MHHIHHTEAIILSARALGEADRLLSCYTRELGLIHARARGVRKMHSKLRYVLTPFSIIAADFVEGRNGWRLTSARPAMSWRTLAREREKRRIVASITSLLARLVRGVEPHEALFLDLREGFAFLDRTDEPNLLRDVEILLVLRLLAALGYWGRVGDTRHLLREGVWNEPVLVVENLPRQMLLAEINRALKATQL